ncbi:hypothetical protein HNQ50_003998 [Silvimonas terrae]|uniref:Uncharacterized protein n=1 Tax=Silvimonas terrae TaxID=300266 RepID=A0A840RKY2_9NEIS|nr:hypothetical protein [Silvimonas terrae]
MDGRTRSPFFRLSSTFTAKYAPISSVEKVARRELADTLANYPPESEDVIVEPS